MAGGFAAEQNDVRGAMPRGGGDDMRALTLPVAGAESPGSGRRDQTTLGGPPG